MRLSPPHAAVDEGASGEDTWHFAKKAQAITKPNFTWLHIRVSGLLQKKAIKQATLQLTANPTKALNPSHGLFFTPRLVA